MPKAMVALANITLGSTQSSVTFSSIPATYRDLRLIVTFSASVGDLIVSANGDSNAANYPVVEVWGNGSTTGSSAFTRGGMDFGYTASTSLSLAQLDIMDYSATDKHKLGLSKFSNASEGLAARLARWASNSAITTLVISPNSASFNAGATFALYGVVA